jgi:branched-chain amino acid transport system permease protein
LNAEFSLLSQTIWSGITIGSIYALIALGFTLIYNVSKIINIAHGEFLMVGALTYYSLYSLFGWPLYIAVPVSLLITALVGWFMVKMAINFLKDSSPVIAIIVTIAFGEIIKGLSMLIWGKQTVGIPTILKGDSVEFMHALIQPQTFVIIIVTLIICLAFSLLMSKTNIGKAMLAASGDSYAANLMGINIKFLVGMSFAISAVIGGLAGILVGPLTMMGYGSGTLLGIKGFIVALLGGMGSYGGAILGGLVLGLLEAFGNGYISSLLKDAFAFAILLIVLFIKPSGLIKSKTD